MHVKPSLGAAEALVGFGTRYPYITQLGPLSIFSEGIFLKNGRSRSLPLPTPSYPLEIEPFGVTLEPRHPRGWIFPVFLTSVKVGFSP